MIRRTPLKRPTLEQVRAFQQRARKPIRKRGRKARREAGSIRAFAAALRARSGGWCEAFDLTHPTICGPARHNGHHPHHVWPEDHDRGVHDPLRGAWLCTTAHNWAHANPTAAAIAGLLRPEVDA